MTTTLQTDAPDAGMAFEQRSLSIAKWANLLMGVLGVAAALLANASALLLDGLFSGVGFLAAVFAGRVAQSVRRSPDALRPFGYEIDEAVYVLFRSLVLIGIILVAAFDAAAKIVRYVAGEAIPVVNLDWVFVYVLVMMVICFGLAAWHHHNWRATKGRSELLRAERSGAIVDGVLSLGAGVAFAIIGALRGTALDFLVPVSDSIVVLALAAYMIGQPIRFFRDAMKEVLGEPDAPEVRDLFAAAAQKALQDTPFSLLDNAVTKMGRSRFAVFYLKPGSPVTADDLDASRASVLKACQSAWVGGPVRLECLFAGSSPLRNRGTASVDKP